MSLTTSCGVFSWERDGSLAFLAQLIPVGYFPVLRRCAAQVFVLANSRGQAIEAVARYRFEIVYTLKSLNAVWKLRFTPAFHKEIAVHYWRCLSLVHLTQRLTNMCLVQFALVWR